jgi:hypothetical protein
MRVKLLKSDTVGIIPADHAHTEVLMPRHLLVEHRNNWVVEVTARAMYIALAVTETPQDVLARLGFEWEEDLGKHIALDGVSFTKQDCRWWLSWDIPTWDLTRVLRFRHFRGNGGGCLDIENVVYISHPREGDEAPLDLVAMYDQLLREWKGCGNARSPPHSARACTCRRRWCYRECGSDAM